MARDDVTATASVKRLQLGGEEQSRRDDSNVVTGVVERLRRFDRGRVVKDGCEGCPKTVYIFRTVPLPVTHLDFLGEGGVALSPRMSTRSDQGRVELLQGTLDLLILRTLRWGPAHGHAIAKAIERGSDDVLLVEQGSLYPALHRLIKRGWITFDDGTSENNRRAKFYRLTAKGRKQLEIETSKWDTLAAAVGRILRPAAQEE
jgi:transcriptional regulator